MKLVYVNICIQLIWRKHQRLLPYSVNFYIFYLNSELTNYKRPLNLHINIDFSFDELCENPWRNKKVCYLWFLPSKIVIQCMDIHIVVYNILFFYSQIHGVNIDNTFMTKKMDFFIFMITLVDSQLAINYVFL